MKEYESRLSGKSVLIIESKDFAAWMVTELYVRRGVKDIVVVGDLPNKEKLLNYMDSKNLDGAIIHTAFPEDEEQILNAFNAGKKILVLKRDSTMSLEEDSFYKRLEENGIATISKSMRSKIEDYIDTLESLY